MKGFIELIQEELDKLLAPVVKKLVQKSFEKAGYILYQDHRCAEDSEFIREYKDGTKELLKMAQ